MNRNNATGVKDTTNVRFLFFKGIKNQLSNDVFIKNSTTPTLNKNINFTGNIKLPVEEVVKLNKKYTQVVEQTSKEELINDMGSSYLDELKQILKKNAPKGAVPKEKRNFWGDFQHELFGAYISQQQLKLIQLPENTTKSEVAQLYNMVGMHVERVMNRYNYLLENNLDDNAPIAMKKIWGLVKQGLSSKAKSKNLKINIENEDIIEKSERLTHEGYKNYIIMMNVLENATKYSPNDSEINAAFKIKDGNVHLIVKDHGIGIPVSDQKEVLENGSRGSNVGNIEGTGHGLYRIFKFLEAKGIQTPKITSPLYPNEPVYKGTQIDVPLILDHQCLQTTKITTPLYPDKLSISDKK